VDKADLWMLRGTHLDNEDDDRVLGIVHGRIGTLNDTTLGRGSVAFAHGAARHGDFGGELWRKRLSMSVVVPMPASRVLCAGVAQAGLQTAKTRRRKTNSQRTKSTEEEESKRGKRIGKRRIEEEIEE
jgi:hypothetical protein